ncbi:MAG: DMT family transporter [Candidatus Limnocylindrales bacterium]
MRAAQPVDSARGSSADLLLLSAIALWSANYAIVKFGISEFNPLAFPVLRFGAGGLVLLAIVRWREHSIGVARSDLPLLLATAILGITLNQACFVYALTITSASDVSLLGATGPIITALLATAVGLERLGRRHWLSVAVGLAGVVLIVAGSANSGGGVSSILGDGLALAATFCSSASVLPIRPLMQRYSAWRILAFEMLVGTALLIPFALPSLVSQDLGRVSLEGWGSLAYAVILTGVVTNVLYFTGIERVGPSRAAVFGYLQSFLGVLFAVVLLGERVAALQIAGGLVVIGSVVLSRSHPGRLLRSAHWTPSARPGLAASNRPDHRRDQISEREDER